MTSYKNIVLDNGLKVVLFNDNNKNRTVATIYTNAGGRDTKFNYDGTDYNQVEGIAHFLEHYLLEKSKYGNIMQYFDNEYINSNGMTSLYTTEYFISTVHDFEENFIKLLNVVNDPKFSEEDIKDVKKPIVSEIKRSLDNPELEFNTYANNCIYKTIKYNSTLGKADDIMNVTIDDLKAFHDAFYQPSNQMIVISGNFNVNKIINIIEDTYKSFKKDYKKTKKKHQKEPVKVIKTEGEYVDKNLEGLVDITYKIDLTSFTPFERYKLSFYIDYLIENNFSEKNPLFREIREKGISVYSVGYSTYMSRETNLLLISLDLLTNKHDEAIEIILDKMNKLTHDEASFNMFHNRVLIKSINAFENINNYANSYVDSLRTCNYDEIDDIKTIKKFNYKEFKELIERLDYSNYCVIKRIKGE